MAAGRGPGLSGINRQEMAVLIHPVHKVMTVVDTHKELQVLTGENIHQEPQAQIEAGQHMYNGHRMVILHQDNH